MQTCMVLVDVLRRDPVATVPHILNVAFDQFDLVVFVVFPMFPLSLCRGDPRSVLAEMKMAVSRPRDNLI